MPGLLKLLAVAAPAVAMSEMLMVENVDCPEALPTEACFMESGPAWSYDGVDLPLDVTVDYVRELLQKAIKVEHGTIPLYLTNLYSLNNQSSFAATTIKSVVMEEMLHMVQAANTLNAIGSCTRTPQSICSLALSCTSLIAALCFCVYSHHRWSPFYRPA